MRLSIAALVVTLATATAVAAKPVPAPRGPLDPLPLKAQVSLDAGIDAAKAGDYPRALQLFDSAASDAGGEAAVLFINRGLVESRMPGRELRAIAWLSAYLGVVPDAPNAAAVKASIKDLRRRADANMVVLAKALVEAARVTASNYHIGQAKGHLGRALLKADDVAGAKALADGLKEYDAAQNFLRLEVAEVLARNGDTAGARLEVAAVEASSAATNTFMTFLKSVARVAGAQAQAGDAAGARQTLGLSRLILPKYDNDPEGRSEVHGVLARAQIAFGDREGARASVTQCLIDAQKGSSLRIYRITDGGIIQAEAGDLEAARATAAALVGEEVQRAYVLMAIAREQVKAGDLAGARTTVNAAEPFMLGWALIAVAEEQIKAGQADAARATLNDALLSTDKMPHQLSRMSSQCHVAFWQMKLRDFDGARATLELAKKSQKKIPLIKDRGRGRDADRNWGAEIMNSKYRELAWIERPWTPWTDHLSGALTSSPFPDVAEFAKTVKRSATTPDDFLERMKTATEAIVKETALIDQMLAGGPPN